MVYRFPEWGKGSSSPLITCQTLRINPDNIKSRFIVIVFLLHTIIIGYFGNGLFNIHHGISRDAVFFCFRAVTDPRDGKRVALKKMPNVFQNLISAKRVYRELRMLTHFKHANVSIK